MKGSTTSDEKLATLKDAGIAPFLIALSENKTTGNLTDFLENSEILIIDVPPKLGGSRTENFVSKIRNVIPFIENHLSKKCFSSVQHLFITMTKLLLLKKQSRNRILKVVNNYWKQNSFCKTI